MPTAKPGILLLAMLITVTAAACSKKDETAVIRKQIAKGAESAETHAIGDLLRLATKDFTAMPGHYNTKSLKGILFAAFRHYGKFNIHYPRPSVDVGEGGKDASAVVYFAIVSRDRTIPGLKDLYDDPRKWLEVAGEKADLYQLKLNFIKEGGDWLVERAALEGFKGWRF